MAQQRYNTFMCDIEHITSHIITLKRSDVFTLDELSERTYRSMMNLIKYLYDSNYTLFTGAVTCHKNTSNIINVVYKYGIKDTMVIFDSMIKAERCHRSDIDNIFGILLNTHLHAKREYIQAFKYISYYDIDTVTNDFDVVLSIAYNSSKVRHLNDIFRFLYNDTFGSDFLYTYLKCMLIMDDITLSHVKYIIEMCITKKAMVPIGFSATYEAILGSAMDPKFKLYYPDGIHTRCDIVKELYKYDLLSGANIEAIFVRLFNGMNECQDTETLKRIAYYANGFRQHADNGTLSQAKLNMLYANIRLLTI